MVTNITVVMWCRDPSAMSLSTMILNGVKISSSREKISREPLCMIIVIRYLKSIGFYGSKADW